MNGTLFPMDAPVDAPARPRPRLKTIYSFRLSMVRENRIPYDSQATTNSREVATMMHDILSTYDREVFAVVLLDRRNKPIGFHIVSVGSLFATIVHPREVFKVILLGNAASFIAVHNHPSGNPEPSNEDKETTRRLLAGAKLLGLDMLDSIVLAIDIEGQKLHFSFADEGQLN